MFSRYNGYEDALFAEHVLGAIRAHDPASPLFLCWTPHIVHTPLQVPAEFLHKFDFMAPTDKKMHQRQIYRERAVALRLPCRRRSCCRSCCRCCSCSGSGSCSCLCSR